jgi:hypothetical protein
MPAIASNLDYVLVLCISAVIAAKFAVAGHRADTAFVPTSVIILSHFLTPIARNNLIARAINHYNRILKTRQ